ncbi:MAG: thioredoxin domain-containing protein [Methanomassiliicoccales archaeon]|nr:thioredoxin domain-containing protein [Methanomassiliicoccales archaeon]
MDWYPWGEEALAKAKLEDKPLFISIGYSACHWCHVMARESFEDDYVASLLNRGFVPIKVDREERPDLDGIYMSACQMISGGGGWPLTIVATPEGRPFFAGTYFSKGGSPGAPGLMDVLQQLESKWKLERGEVLGAADEIAKALKEFASFREPAKLSPDALAVCFKQLQSSFDERNGGFEIAPKFPSPHRLVFLMRYRDLSGDEGAMRMAVATLRSMQSSGLFDHVGFGFHRYSTDARWLLPHFEKMLYDQGTMLLAYSEAFARTKDDDLKETALRTAAYVGRELTSPYGAFYSAESAESEGEEGKFYVWSKDEIVSTLALEDLQLFMEAFDIQEEGNFRDEASRRRTGKNVLHLAKDAGQLAASRGMDEAEVRSSLQRSLAKLYEVRELRPRPEKDDKVLTDWNGLMVAAFSRASVLLWDKSLAASARRAADFLLSEMRTGSGLMHRFVDGKVGIDGFIDDYAFTTWGMVELHRAIGLPRYLDAAIGLADEMVERFWDKDQGGFFFTSDRAEGLIARRMEGYDGAVPSGNSVAANVLLDLARLAGRPDLKERSDAIVKAFAGDINANPMAHAHMLQQLMDARDPMPATKEEKEGAA